MSENQLRFVRNFSITNHYGTIKWLDPVDLVGVDLQDITIKQRTVAVYENVEK